MPKKKKTTISKAKKRADAAFSLYIRYRDKGVCVTCGKEYEGILEEKVKKMQCGHFIRRNHLPTRYNEMNCNCQCSGCNVWGKGKEVEHAEYITKKYGEGVVEHLYGLARKIIPMRVNDYLEIEEFYKNCLNQLKNVKK